MEQEKIETIRKQTAEEIKDIMKELEKDCPGVTEGLATALGAGIGAAGSFAALVFGGVTGLSAVGITSGLAAAGTLIGGGMVAGIGVLAAPVIALGFLGYTLNQKRKEAAKKEAMARAIYKFENLRAQLIPNKDHFKEEISAIDTSINFIATLK